jgi:hypothetical protein
MNDMQLTYIHEEPRSSPGCLSLVFFRLSCERRHNIYLEIGR